MPCTIIAAMYHQASTARNERFAILLVLLKQVAPEESLPEQKVSYCGNLQSVRLQYNHAPCRSQRNVNGDAHLFHTELQANLHVFTETEIVAQMFNASA